MATTLTLYKDVELNNKYQDVFKTQALLEDYLSSRVSATITGEWYFKMTGEFNLPVSKYEDTPNYMKTVDTVSGNTTYYFINNYEVYNAVYKISYMIDVWHTYLGKFKVKDGRRNLSSTVLGEYADIPYEMILNERKSMGVSNIGKSTMPSSTDLYVLLASGYYYEGVDSYSTKPSKSASFLTFSSDYYGKPQTFTFTGVMEEAQTLIQNFSSTSISFSAFTGYLYFNITNIWAVPYYAYYNILSNLTSHLTPLTVRFNTSSVTYTFNSTTSGGAYYICRDHLTSTVSYGDIYYGVFTGGYSYETTLTSYTSPIFNNSYPSDMQHYICTSIGVGRQGIEIPRRIYNSSHDIKIYEILGIGGFSCNVEIGNDCYERADGWQVTLNYSPEQLSTTDERRANAIAGLTTTLTSAATNIQPQNTSSLVNSAGSIVSQLMTAFAPHYSETKGSSDISPYTNIKYDMNVMCYKVQNYEEVNDLYRLYGVLVDCPMYSDTLDDATNYDYNVIGYSNVNVCGEVPEQYKNALEVILLNGTRVWQKVYSSLDPLSTYLSNPPSLVNI